VETSSQVETFQCDQCEHLFKTENRLKIHIGKTHKVLLPQLDGHSEDIPTGLVMKTDKEAEVQTEPGYVTVAVKEVPKTYEIFVKESLKERIDEELESFWEGNGINGFSVTQVQDNFMVEISYWEFSKSFTAFSAAGLLSSLL
jgi:hypothetical protein